VQLLQQKLDEAKREIKSGKCAVLPKKGNKGFDIVIPNSVRDRLKTLES
jgi:hypothetical protein